MSARRSEPPEASTPNWDNLGMLMAVTFRAIVERHSAVLAEQGEGWLRPSHAYVLHAVEEQPRSIKELAEINQVSKQAMSQLVDQLEERDFISRAVNPTDRRSWDIAITQEGRQQLIRAAQAWATVEDEVAGIVGRDELDRTMQTLRLYLKSDTDASKSTRLSRVW
ncbi:MarR family winged helix-turn-helix transcriptional regulator [Nocardia sp. NPDC001965]